MALLDRVQAAGLVGFRSPALAALGVPHWFSTRRTTDAAVGTPDLTRVRPEIGARIVAAAGAEEATRIVRVHQVHGAEVLDGDAEPSGVVRADAILVAATSSLALVRAADCVPVLLAGPDGERVAAVHAGWRGVVAGVVPATIERMGPCAAAAIGPSISVRRFEVGEEVADAFRAAELAEAVIETPGRKPHVDLRLAIRLQLLRAAPGIAVDVSDACTYDADELWSYRRDVTHGDGTNTGRQGAVIAPAHAARSDPGGRGGTRR